MSIELERQILGVALQDPLAQSIVMAYVEPQWFTDKRLQQVYLAIRVARGQIDLFADLAAIAKALRHSGQLKELGELHPTAMLGELYDEAPTRQNLLYHIELLRQRVTHQREIERMQPRTFSVGA